MTAEARPRERVFEQLTGDTCDYCDDGELERGTYKGTRAVLCDECGTPAVRFW